MALPWAGVEGRVLIAFTDDPLAPSPTWTRIDAPGGGFPDQFVSGYDFKNGKQTLLAQTDTGTATVYINDHKYGLFDPRNASSPYYEALEGKQILLQLYNPVAETWEPQFKGLIDSLVYSFDNTAVNGAGDPINVTIEINCVDMFDYLAGFGLTPGLAGDRPPSGADDGVWYAATAGEVRDRLIQVSADVGLDVSQYVFFSGNVALQTAKYDADESSIAVYRDCADAELPFIAQSLYVDRFGRVVFHGRYGRFDPDSIAAAAGTDRWIFNRFSLGDGKSVRDEGRTQMRVLDFARARANLVNVAVCYPQGTPNDRIRNQVYADVTSINEFGHYAAPPMENILTAKPINDRLNGHPTWDRFDETLHYAELIVKNMKDPRESLTALQIKSVHPLDSRAADVWEVLTRADVNDIVNVKIGYPAGTGFTGASPDDDYYIEGREVRVRPLNSQALTSALPGFDYVELDLEVSPAVWSMDTHNVFPDWPGGGT